MDTVLCGRSPKARWSAVPAKNHPPNTHKSSKVYAWQKSAGTQVSGPEEPSFSWHPSCLWFCVPRASPARSWYSNMPRCYYPWSRRREAVGYWCCWYVFLHLKVWKETKSHILIPGEMLLHSWRWRTQVTAPINVQVIDTAISGEQNGSMSSCYRQHILQCLIFLLDQYFRRLAKNTILSRISFLLKTKSFVPASDDESWYECVAIGKNSPTSMLKGMCQEAGIEEKTNHSLRATGTMSMFQANVSERVIQKTTGHRPLQALWSYSVWKIFSRSALTEKWCLHNLALLLLTLCGLLQDQNVLQETLENCL